MVAYAYWIFLISIISVMLTLVSGLGQSMTSRRVCATTASFSCLSLLLFATVFRSQVDQMSQMLNRDQTQQVSLVTTPHFFSIIITTSAITALSSFCAVHDLFSSEKTVSVTRHKEIDTSSKQE